MRCAPPRPYASLFTRGPQEWSPEKLHLQRQTLAELKKMVEALGGRVEGQPRRKEQLLEQLSSIKASLSTTRDEGQA